MHSDEETVDSSSRCNTGAMTVRYRWTCPYCKTSRTIHGNYEQSVRKQAESAVRGHVSTSDGAGHRPRYSVPEDFTPDGHIGRIEE